MSDDRLFDSFHVLDRPIQPDAGFAEHLFEALAADLGFRPVTRREAIVRRFTDASPTFRLAYLAAILGFLLAAAIVAALVGAELLNTKTALDIVAASQAAQLDPPAYDMTIQADDGRIIRVRTDGHGAWRLDRISDQELPAGTVGTFEVRIGGQRGAYDPGDNTWSVSDDDLPLWVAAQLGWELPGHSSKTLRPSDWFNCSSWLRLGDDVIAGRPAYHLACDAREFWVDQASSVLVGMMTPAGQELGGVSGRATALSVGPSFPLDTFALTAPAGALSVDPNKPPASTVLAVGRNAPRLTGTTLDGKAFDTGTQPGPLVVFFWGTWCLPCIGSPLTDLQTVATRHAAEVATATIATDDQLGAVTGYLKANGIRLAVVNDSGLMMKTWGIRAIPALVMLDRSGAVAVLRLGPVSASELDQMYVALAAGEPVPTPVASAVPPVEAPSTYAPGAK